MFVTDLAGAAKFGGPKAIAIEAARRGGREVAEYAVQKLVEDGKITREQAQSAMRAVDKVAPEGVPEPVKRQLMQGIDAARDVATDRIFTDENIDRAQDAISGVRESIGERASASRDTASRVLSRLRNVGGGKEKEPSVDDMLFESFSQPDDPFDPFTGEPMSPPDMGSTPSRTTSSDPFSIDPFTGMPEAPQAETSRRRRRLFGRSGGRAEEQTQAPSSDPWDPFSDYTPDRSVAISAADRAPDPFGDDWTRSAMGLSSGRDRSSAQLDEDATIARIRSIPTTEYDVTGNRGALKSTNSSKDIQQGLSSGREGGGNVRRDLKRGSIEAEPMIISTDRVEDDYRNKQYYEAEVWNIGGEKIVFGLVGKAAGRNWGDEQFENIPINPYKISGHSPDTPEGRALALKWLSANVAYKSKDRTYVEALLYAASRGDEDAAEELDRLAAEGDALIEKAKVDRDGDWKPSEYQLNEVKKEGLDNLKIEDLYVVHETKYDTEEDEDGNLIIRPMGDYEIKGYDGETLDADGNPHEYYRGTVHFTLNHLAKGHMFRQRSDKPTNVIIIPLKDMLEANPGSLDVLYPIDTYLTPKPNEPLRFPKGVTRVVKNEGGENADKVVSDALREMGAPHVFEGGESYSTTGQDVSVKLIADEMGAGFGAHADKIHAMFERITSRNDTAFGVSARDVADMSENARLRIANNDRWLGAKVKVESDGLFSGRTRGMSSRKNRADSVASEAEIGKTPEAPAAAETPKSPAPRVVNGVAQRGVRLPQGLAPVDDFSEAMEKGAPWSPLLPQSYSPEVQAAVDSIYEMVDRERLPNIFTVSQGLDPEKRAFDKEELTRVANTIYNNLASMGVPTDGIDNGEGWSYGDTTLTNIIDADTRGNSYSPAFLMTTAIIERTISDIKAQADFDSGRKSVEKLTQVSADTKHDRVMTVVPLSAIDSVLDTRRIMSQFEVGASRGYLSYGFRSVLEASQFGYPPSMRPASRPIYGVSVPEKMDAADFMWSEQYGELKFVMKDEVQGRTTYTIGDSANDIARPAPIGVVAPTSMYESSGVHAEAQMHGGISLDDVAEVIVRSESISPEDMQMLRTKLQAAGIKLSVVDLSSSSDYDSFIELKKDGATVIKEVREARGRA
jgi:hypothetical protein